MRRGYWTVFIQKKVHIGKGTWTLFILEEGEKREMDCIYSREKMRRVCWTVFILENCEKRVLDCIYLRERMSKGWQNP
jgi:hypothetical protein